MKIEDFKKVEFLIKLRAKLNLAIIQCDDYLAEEPDIDAGGIEGFNEGFWGAFSSHDDGSGEIVKLSGCYVAVPVVEAIRDILANQRQDALDALTNLGVEL